MPPSNKEATRGDASRTRAAAKRRLFQPKDLLSRVLVTDAALSPDGETIVFGRQTVLNGKERSRLWRVPISSGRPQPLTNADTNSTVPRFSPDGRWLGFLSDRVTKEAEKVSQSWRLPIAGGEAEPFPTLPDGADSLEWAPNADAILCTGSSGVHRFAVGDPKDPTARTITAPHWLSDGQGIRDPLTSAWVVPLEGEPVRVTDPAHMVSGAFWSPNGERVGFLADRSNRPPEWDQPGLWSTSRSGGDVRELVAFGGSASLAAWGPRKIAFTGTVEPYPAFHNVGVFVADEGGIARRLAEDADLTFVSYPWSELLPLTDLGPIWIDDSRFLVFASTRGRCIPYLVDEDEEPRPIFAPDTTTEIAHAAVGGGRVVVIASVDGGAGELYELDPENGGMRQITKEAARWFGPFRRSPEEIVVTHPSEGHGIQGWLTRTTGAESERRPLVLEIHGGPYESTRATQLAEVMILADAGFHVAAMNPRGSMGFGETFTGALHGRWGVPDASDLLATVDHLAAEGLVDPDRVGILGLSYGGFMVNHLLGAFPGRFRAGVSENPFTEAFADLGAADYGLTMEPDTGVGPFPEDMDGWLALSPAFRIHRNHAPLLLLQAEDDVRCPPVHSQVIFAILQHLGRTVEFVRYPGEHHIMAMNGRPDRRVDRLERILDWFQRYL